MRLLLSRGSLGGAMVLIAIGISHSALPQRPLAATTASVTRLPIPGPVSAATPRWVTTPTPTPSPPRPTPRRATTRVARATIAATPAPKAPGRNASGAGQWRLINQDRQAAGLPPLAWSDCLANVAVGQATRMEAQGYISHANGRILDLGCHISTRSGENIGYQSGIQDAAMNAWFMGDAPHRANILGPYHAVGAAWVVSPNGSAYLAVEFS